MIDLHMHSNYSDGTENCSSILKKCQDKKLDYISITDHNTALAYKELENKNLRNLYEGKIIPGIELNTKVLDIPIEILGYGIDYTKMNNLINKIYISNDERNYLEATRLYEKCLKYGLKLSKNCLDNYSKDMYASVFFHREITKNIENKNLISNEAWQSSIPFYRQYMSNPQTPLYVEIDDFVPNFETAANLIKECGGLVFIPHIHEYKNNSMKVLNYILGNYKIDGIECYYTTFSDDQHKEILKISKENGLHISGGSDFHGKIKPNVDIGNGYGNLHIPTSILTDWVDKVSLL